MIRRLIVAGVVAAAMAIASQPGTADAQQPGYAQSVGGQSSHNMDRFYHYPYVYYPQNYWSQNYYRSADNMYYRYPAEMRIPVYNRQWYNYYPTPRRYHFGHHFLTDIF